ncbi:MAG: AI-2E family transporter [Clostridia bacterium]|nr:AI-2E family transporter [Clostridia bacterium]
MKKNNREENKRYLKLLGVICAAILFYGLIMHLGMVITALGILWKVLLPFVLGLAIAFVVNLPLRFLENKIFYSWNRKKRLKKLKRPLCLIISWVILLASFLAIFALILPNLVSTVKEFLVALPGYMDRLDQTLADLIQRYHLPINHDTININWSSISNYVLNWLNSESSSVTNVTLEILSGTITAMANLLIGIVFSIYVLASKESLARLGKSILYSHFKKERAQQILQVCTMSNKAFSGFISGQCMEAIVIGVLCYIGMMIFQFDTDTSLMVSSLISITALIPIFGAIVGAVLGALIILLISPWRALLFLVFILVLQQVESNVIYPKIMGKSVGLPGIWVLVAVTVGGGLGGIPGMVISVPTVSVLFTLYERWMNKRLIERNIHKNMLVFQEDGGQNEAQTHVDFDHSEPGGPDEEDDQDGWDHDDWTDWEKEHAEPQGSDNTPKEENDNDD